MTVSALFSAACGTPRKGQAKGQAKNISRSMGCVTPTTLSALEGGSNGLLVGFPGDAALGVHVVPTLAPPRDTTGAGATDQRGDSASLTQMGLIPIQCT
jgi:hypothetical protein